MRELIRMTKPKYLIPSNAGIDKTIHGADLAKEMGYKLNKNMFLLSNGKNVDFK
jgi:mRNA degradation ribonuclease J1/J2